jgi:uncharacterized membrane protein/predicted DsbA family dithiol-disulfide isomerase
MENWQRLLVIRSTALVALAVSVTLLTAYLLAYLLPQSHLCPFDSDCDEVLSSPFGTAAGVPLPVFGVLVFTAIFACSFAGNRRWLLVLRGLALAASVGGAALILIQVFVLQKVCPFCLIVDSCALLIAYVAFGYKPDAPPALTRRLRQIWSAAAVAALAAGAVLGTAGSWRSADEETLPPQVVALWVADKVNVVEITDFQCPHCRSMHQVLTRALDKNDPKIRFVRVMAPMPKHPLAREAARAYLAARALGKGEEMAEKLFEANNLSPDGCEELAVKIGLSLEAYRAALDSPEIDREIDANLAWVAKACPKGLPCLWVQERRFFGSQSGATLREAIAEAEQRLPTPP